MPPAQGADLEALKTISAGGRGSAPDFKIVLECLSACASWQLPGLSQRGEAGVPMRPGTAALDVAKDTALSCWRPGLGLHRLGGFPCPSVPAPSLPPQDWGGWARPTASAAPSSRLPQGGHPLSCGGTDKAPVKWDPALGTHGTLTSSHTSFSGHLCSRPRPPRPGGPPRASAGTCAPRVRGDTSSP